MIDFNYKKSLGQNFLKDENIINKIVSAPSIKKNNLVIEVGPGAGALSKRLVNLFDNVLMYEIDTRLCEILDDTLSEYNNYKIIFDDFLRRDVFSDLKKYKYDHLYVVANLPYYVTSPIVMKIIKDKLPVDEMVIMIQKEVAERYTSVPGKKEYGEISVYLQYFFEISKVCNVSKNAFIPRPQVDSCVIKMKKRSNLLYVKNFSFFEKLVKDSFRFKRKTIRNNLNNYDLDIVDKVLAKYGYDINIRSENLSYEIFVDMANELSN